jgi:hypothetical protein
MTTDQVPLSFEKLTEARRSLQDFCRLHVHSLLILRLGVSFLFHPDESETEFSDGAVHNLTTTATCIASLLECPPRFWPAGINTIETLQKDFSSKALERPGDRWKSEDSAAVYCRCRALPMVIYGLAAKPFPKAIERHIAAILFQLKEQPERFGIGEADPESPEPNKDWYPPNAFHTYWTLEILERARVNSPSNYQRLSNPKTLDLARRRDGMLLWARNKLGYQIGLHSSDPQSSLLDTDQLAWSLAILLRFDNNLRANLESRDFIKQALKCLFSTQVDGTWRHYKPLFHYSKVGNAYCYVFETFAALLQSAFREGIEGEMIRELLAPYCENLLSLWRYANSTKIELSRYADFAKRLAKREYVATGREIGWCSDHRTNFSNPESWATASVFSYAQSLRRLVGVWCRQQAFDDLKTPKTQVKPADAEKEIVRRGTTWGSNKTNKPPISEILWTSFINPVKMRARIDKLDPDSQPIAENQARSAILFGPPGTSKTSLIRNLAGAIGWQYVELHASHFVAEGLTQVQKTADKIFKQLMELDQAVVLFDEIDELVRERDIEKDAFGRFLTTSMLPKLAVLWEARKILYFVATNHIKYFDTAIIRSQRFDALMLVGPPAFETKKNRLIELLEKAGFPKVRFDVEEQEIQKEFDSFRDALTSPLKDKMEQALGAHWEKLPLPSEYTFAKFAMLRYDETEELAYHLAKILRDRQTGTRKITNDILRQALANVADSFWRKNKDYSDYLKDIKSQRRDYKMFRVWRCTRSVKKPLNGLTDSNGHLWLDRAVNSLEDIDFPGFRLKSKPPGQVQLRAVRSK